MSESIADSVNGTRIPIFSVPSAMGAAEGGALAVHAVRATTSARSAGPRGPALLDDRLLRGIDELVGHWPVNGHKIFLLVTMSRPQQVVDDVAVIRQ